MTGAERSGGESGLTEDPVHLGAAHGANPPGHPAAVGFGDLTVEVTLLLALHAIPVEGLSHWLPISFIVCRSSQHRLHWGCVTVPGTVNQTNQPSSAKDSARRRRRGTRTPPGVAIPSGRRGNRAWVFTFSMGMLNGSCVTR